jgi:AcrR family transcriptional regulator
MGTQARRQRERRSRRRDILRAARGLFWERGYAGTTMPEIAEAAELAPGTLYLYFASKSALYAELLFEGYDALLARLTEALEAPGSAQERAEGLVDSFFGFARECPEYFDVIFFVVQSESGRSLADNLAPEQVKRLHSREEACKAVAARAMQLAGYDRSPGDAQAVLDAIWSMLVGTVFYFRKAGPRRFAAVTREARQLLVNAFFRT